VGLIILTTLLVIAALLALRFMGPVGERRRARVEEAARKATEQAVRKRGIENTIECTVCGAYRADSMTTECGREGCPWSKTGSDTHTRR